MARTLYTSKRKPRKQDEPTSGAMTKTSHLSNNRGHYTKSYTNVKNFVHFGNINLGDGGHIISAHPKSPEFNRGSYPRTRRNPPSATTIHPDPVPFFYPATLD